MTAIPPEKKTKTDVKAEQAIRKKQEQAKKAAAKRQAQAKKQALAAQKKAEKPPKKPLKEIINEKFPSLNYEFTKREKTLLYILGMFLMVMGIFFLVLMPGLNRYQDLSAQKDERRQTKEKMTLSISTLAANQTALDNTRVALSTKKESFAQQMNNAQLDSFVTSFVVNNGLTPQSLSIDSLSASPLATYSPGSTGENTTTSGDIESGSTTTSTTGDSTTTSVAQTSATGVVIGTVTVSFKGGADGLMSLLSNANARTDIQVMASDYTVAQQTGSVTLNVYMSYESGQLQAVKQTEAK
ncbi:hypothetical protein [Eubacterium sp.]|uniref:hypothetical protein n=1 Tax=Eubacterium sp. TaxID=142586 RepID=UPI002FC7A46A